MAVEVSKAEAEITELKDRFGEDCHVICDVGDFSHVVTISFKKWCMKLKFQITGIYHKTYDSQSVFTPDRALIV